MSDFQWFSSFRAKLFVALAATAALVALPAVLRPRAGNLPRPGCVELQTRCDRRGFSARWAFGCLIGWILLEVKEVKRLRTGTIDEHRLQ